LAEKNQAGLKLQVKLQEQAVADLNTTWKNLTGNKVLKGERVALQEADAAASRHAEHLQDLRDAYNETGAGAAALANQQLLLGMEADNLNVKYEHAVEMFGKTGREAEIYELKLKGATDEQLAAAQATHEKLLAMEAEADMMKKGEALVERYKTPQAKLADQQAELNKLLAAGAIDQETYNAAMKDAEKAAKGQGNAVRDTINNLKEQVHTYGLNERQLLEYKLAQQGASEAETAAALAHHETLQQLKQQQAIDDYIDKVRQEAETLSMTAHELDIYKAKKAGATEAQLDGMRAAQAEQAAAKKQQDQLKKGKALIEKYKDPQQKFIDQQSELNTLLAAGAIDQQTYDKALADAKKALDETAESVDQDFNVDLSVSGVEAVEAGTAEAAARLRDYLDQRDTAQQDAQTLADAVQAAEQVQQAAQPPADVVQQVQAAEQVLTWPEDAMWALAGALEEFGQTTITGLENEQQVLTTAQQVQPVDAQPVGAPPVGASSAQRSTDHEERTEDLLGRIATATEDLSDSLQTAGL
jgi:hypothetical protein